MSGRRRIELFDQELKVINLGIEVFCDDPIASGAEAVQVDWRPPAARSDAAERLLTALKGHSDRIAAANREAADRILKARSVLKGIGLAGEVIPGMGDTMVLHSGPPVRWADMCGPMRGAVTGALFYEGLARDVAQADELASSGGVAFSPCHEHRAVGPMAGVVSASMPVWIVENEAFGNRAYATLNEGLGKVLRYGANSGEVVDRLRWMRDELAQILKEALALRGAVDMRALIAQALQMGDEGTTEAGPGPAF